MLFGPASLGSQKRRLHSVRARALPAHSLREKYFFTGKAGKKMIETDSAFCGKRTPARKGVNPA